MTSSGWYDGLELLAKREMVVIKDGAEEPAKMEELLEVLEAVDDPARRLSPSGLAWESGQTRSSTSSYRACQPWRL